MITNFNKIHLVHIGQAFLLSALVLTPVAIFMFESFSEFFTNHQNKTVLLLSYALYTLIISIIFIKITHAARKKKSHQLEVINKLQSEFLQKQLDPHFTFNVLNSVSAAILNDNKHEAYHQLTVFAKVLRYTYDNKTKLFHQLDNEIDLLNNYLQLEKHRFKEKFDYEVNVDSEIDLITHIPKQIIQIHVDNAIKHGLMPLKSGGLVKVDIQKVDEENVGITVTDNGIGREKAESQNMHMRKSHSIKIMKDLINYFNNLKSEERISMKIYDLYKNGKPAGTKVTIVIPMGLRINQ